MTGSLGWNTVSFTLPLCPGSLYMRLRVAAFQMYTQRSALPAVTCRNGGDVCKGADRSGGRSQADEFQ